MTALKGEKREEWQYMLKEHSAQSTYVITTGSSSEVEYVLLYIRDIETVNITIYRPPGCSTPNFICIIEMIKSEISKIGSPDPIIILNGDYNFPIITWRPLSVYEGSPAERTQSEVLLQLMEEFMLIQRITSPTRGSNILDLFMTNNDELVSALNTEDTIISDHRLVVVETILDRKSELLDRKDHRDLFTQLNFFSEDTKWEAINDDLLVIQWDTAMDNKNSQQMFHWIHSDLLRTCQKHTPKRKQRQQRTRSQNFDEEKSKDNKERWELRITLA